MFSTNIRSYFDVFAQFAIVVLFIYSFYFLYIRRRYDNLMKQQAAQILQPVNKIPPLVFIIISAIILVIILFYDWREKKFTFRYWFEILSIMILVMAIEGSVFGLIAPKMKK